MKFLVDAQLPRQLALRLVALGHEAVHTLELPQGNRTTDQSICVLADEVGAIVITKDADFVISRALRGTPHRLLVVSTGNIGNSELVQLVAENLTVIITAFNAQSHVELSRDALIIHE